MLCGIRFLFALQLFSNCGLYTMNHDDRPISHHDVHTLAYKGKKEELAFISFKSMTQKSPCVTSLHIPLTRFWWMVTSTFFLIFTFTLFYFTILYWFCHTWTWIRHGCTWVPNPEPPSHLPPHIISLDQRMPYTLRKLWLLCHYRRRETEGKSSKLCHTSAIASRD